MITNTVEKIELKNIALLGNPNAGKSSLFNALTGLNQKIGNYSGVTIDKNTGVWTLADGQKIDVTDLPGIYSLFAKSPDECVVLEALLDAKSPDRPDLLIVVLDASNLQRSLLLLDQLKNFDFPIVACLNMTDVASARGLQINAELLSAQIDLPVIAINARLQEGLSQLESAVKDYQPKPNYTANFLEEHWEKELALTVEVINPLHAKILLSQGAFLRFLSDQDKDFIQQLQKKHELDLLQIQTKDSQQRLLHLEKITKTVTNQHEVNQTFTDKVDRILMHPILGYVVFFVMLLIVFQAIFNLAAYPMDWIDLAFTNLSAWLGDLLPESLLTDLFVDGIVAGIGGIVIFIPQIAILFGIISILEETGYMSRVMFLTDKTMSRFGLNGKSIVPLISGTACAVPAIMATRSIRNWKERLATIMVTPLMSCAARLPVYIIFITLVIPSTYVLGIIDMQALVLAGLYLGGFVAALLSALVFSKWLNVGTDNNSKNFFVMELPSYKLPQWKSVGITIYQKTSDFVFEAGKIIIAISIILWVLATYGPPQAMQQAEVEATEIFEKNPAIAESLDQLIASKQLEASYIGHLGHFIEPAIKPLGYDWKIGIALITSFAAREVFVSTMATIYSVGEEDGMEKTLLEKLRSEKNPDTGELVFSPAVSYSLLIFYLFAMQCMATLAIVQRETKSWKWPLLQLAYMTALAYLGALLTFQLFS